jgi:putative aldouronate transport system permease protein
MYINRFKRTNKNTEIISKKKWSNTKIGKEFTKNYDLLIMSLPMIVYYIIFHYWPLYGVQIAFRNYNPVLGFLRSPFVGLKHFYDFFSLPIAIKYIQNTLRISITSLFFSLPVPIILALMLNSLTRNGVRKKVQTILYIPHSVSTIIIVGMLNVFLNPRSGIVNRFLNMLGIASIDFINKPQYFIPVYVISSIWQSAGWNSIIYTGALSGINPELYEAATIDGASKLQKIIHLELPVIYKTAVILLILNIGGIMSVGWEKAFLMQVPLNLEVSEIISTYTYKVGIISTQYSYASAIGLFNSVVNFILLLLSNFISRNLSGSSLW